MNTKHITFIVLFLFISSSVYAQTPIEIEDIRLEMEADSPSKEQIQTDIELKLRLAGIKVLTEEERYREPGYPYLYVQISTIGGMRLLLEGLEGRPYGYSFNISLIQWVYLARDREMYHNASTWRITPGYVWHVGEVNFMSQRDMVNELVNRFINDYLSVNPK